MKLNAELLTQIEENLEWLRGAALFDTERVMGPVRALLARVEAAERDARNDLDDAELHLRRAEAAATALVARVAELEAASDAQGWRPVTEKPAEPPDGETSEYLTWNDFVGFTVRRYHDGQFRSVFRNPPTHWRPLPPAPQEPTP